MLEAYHIATQPTKSQPEKFGVDLNVILGRINAIKLNYFIKLRAVIAQSI